MATSPVRLGPYNVTIAEQQVFTAAADRGHVYIGSFRAVQEEIERRSRVHVLADRVRTYTRAGNLGSNRKE